MLLNFDSGIGYVDEYERDAHGTVRYRVRFQGSIWKGLMVEDESRNPVPVGAPVYVTGRHNLTLRLVKAR